VAGAEVLRNGDARTVEGVTIQAVPAYNIVNMRSPGNPFHPKGSGNGYVLTIGGLRIYIAGDTENIPEMSNLGAIDCAFLPMNLPYTMTPAMVTEAAKRIKPKILYPYHFGNTDTNKLLNLLSDQQDTEIRVRNMK
jgi:L-ascorbate metabolism protein UlaG (beta-lactamase superfamily)